MLKGYMVISDDSLEKLVEKVNKYIGTWRTTGSFQVVKDGSKLRFYQSMASDSETYSEAMRRWET